MSCSTDSETSGYTFVWKIVNVNHCWLKIDERMESPHFFADALNGTSWLLRLYPNKNENIVLRLYRTAGCSGPREIHVNYQFCVMDKDGEFLISTTPKNECFTKVDGSWSNSFVREKIFVTEKDIFLPEDTLTVCCKIWKKEETLRKQKHMSARTVFKVNRRSFVWEIEKFSNVKPGVKNKFKDDLIHFDLVLKEGLDFEKSLALNCISINTSVKFFSFKASILNSEGEIEESGTHVYFENDLQKGTFLTLLFAKKVFENKNRYLLNDVLTLDCECICSTGTVLEEYFVSGIISSEPKNGVVEKRINFSWEQEKNQQTLDLGNDLKVMYTDGAFSDTEVRTSTKTFPAHKNILSARSPVFKRMFSNDMRENHSGHIDIDDLEDDTVHRMLLYMYTGSLEDLQFENACKLYVAADKYEILPLRSMCSACLKHSLCPTKACDILAVADRHCDEDLKNAAQDFILKHNEVFASEKWKQLMATNLQLAADVMYRKVYPA